MKIRRKNELKDSILFVSESEFYMSYLLLFPNKNLPTKQESIELMSYLLLYKLKQELMVDVVLTIDNKRADTFTKYGKHFNYYINKSKDYNRINKILKSFHINIGKIN